MTDSAPYLFISYRRDDAQWIARALYRISSSSFGPVMQQRALHEYSRVLV